MLYNRPVPQHRPTTRNGFTLVELLVVLAIILILSGFVFGLSRGIAVKQARSKAQSELQTLGLALENYRMKLGDYPWLGADTGGTELYKHLVGELKMVPGSEAGKAKVDEPGSEIPFIDASKLTVMKDGDGAEYFSDPWGQPYEYYYKPSGGGNWAYTGFILLSVGADGADSSTGLSEGNISQDYFEDAEEKNVDNMVFGFEF
ncbi:prepilin-type N-terminal cleavage/methylation domain-containing protein [Cerasicoccus arenae]|uniref:Type II secretion system protein GspG C-terminal domain-containing protein n=1 Tax=Cerasicoccus arenae TaxID=424488 RepID=A0A8J3DBR7_9BACT|nr:prepilin-type N-terminal cleavage/methylation domain-containing protein [Cerasicoccus arenae]MBK1857226.1 prepilin-type N-terminal cleavage/methylation domain-containing protein [Cerasicoccus arenae]GHC00119.1 hypothetical protein GCM10007047_15460 [Cerasicoccus arenae]